MKKNYLILISIFLSCQIALCQEAFYTGVPFYDNNKMKFPKSSESLLQEDAQPVGSSVNTQEDEDIYIPKKSKKNKILGIFQKKEEDPEKKTRFNTLTNRTEEIPRGYWGKLPNIEEAFHYKNQDMPTNLNIAAIIPDNNISEDDLKKMPFDDALFLDKIIMKDEPSQYIKDIQKTKFALNNLKKCIENESSIQLFNAAVNTIDLYVKSLQKKYSNEPESNKTSYINIVTTSYQAKVLGNLMYDAGYYARYTPTNQGQYSNENIAYEKRKLLDTVLITIDSIEKEG